MRPRRRTMVALAALAAACLVGAGACGDGEDRPAQVSASGSGSGSGTTMAMDHHMHAGQPAFGADDADTVVHAVARDFAFDGVPATAKGPKVYWAVANEGPSEHELSILDADGEEVGGTHLKKTGDRGVVAVALKPGTYSIECHVLSGGKEHTALGMKTSLTVE